MQTLDWCIDLAESLVERKKKREVEKFKEERRKNVFIDDETNFFVNTRS